MPRCAALPTLDGHGRAAVSGASSNIATVNNRAAFGGVTSDHLVMKQLGKLFDEWREQKEQEDAKDAIEATPSAGGRFLIGRSDIVATPRTPRIPATPGRADGFHRLLRAGTRGEGLVGGEVASSPVPESEVDGKAVEGGSQSSGF